MGDVVSVLGSGADLGVEFTFKVQDRAGGASVAVHEASGQAERFGAVILGDNIFSDSIAEDVDALSEGHDSAHLLLAEVPDPKRFGVAEFKDGELVRIHEKPRSPTSPFAVAGIYMYDNSVFEIIDDLQPSDRGELEITDVNSEFIRGQSATYRILNGWWTDAGTFESLATAAKFARICRLALFESTRNHRPHPVR